MSPRGVFTKTLTIIFNRLYTKTTTQMASTTIISHWICTCTALIPPGLWQSSLCSHSGTDEQFWKAMKVLLCARICSIKAIPWTFLHMTLENRMTTFFKQIQIRLVPHSCQQNMFSSTGFNWMKIRNRELKNWIFSCKVVSSYFKVLKLKLTSSSLPSSYKENYSIQCLTYSSKHIKALMHMGY